MGKFIPDDLKKFVSKEIEKIGKLTRILTDEEIKKKLPNVLEFYKNPENEEKIYFDGYRTWLFIHSPKPEFREGEEKPFNRARICESKFSDESNFRWVCKFKKGFITLFLNKEQLGKIGWDNTVLITGKMKIQYTMGGGSEYLKSLKEVAQALNKPNIGDLAEDDYNKRYQINIWQVIE